MMWALEYDPDLFLMYEMPQSASEKAEGSKGFTIAIRNLNTNFTLCNRLPAVNKRFNSNFKACNRLHKSCNRLLEGFFRK